MATLRWWVPYELEMQEVLTATTVLTRLAKSEAQTTLEWEAPPWPGRMRLPPSPVVILLYLVKSTSTKRLVPCAE